MGKLKVIAKEGTRCPMEGRPRQYITDQKPSEVPDTTFYRRLIRDGSLVMAKTTKGGDKS